MTWTMPRRVLQIVAVLIGLCAVGGFAMGLGSTPMRRAAPADEGPAGNAPPLVAADARPINTEEVAPPPEPEKPEEAPEEKKPVEKAPAPVEKAPVNQVETPAPQPPADRVGDLLDAVTPPPSDDPPH